MIRKTILGLVVLFGVAGLVTFGLWFTSPDPQGNAASLEDTPIAPSVLPLEDAVTLARLRRPDGRIATLLVLGVDGEQVQTVDLGTLGAAPVTDPFESLASLGERDLAAAASGAEVETVQIADLLPVAGEGTRHIATGTNFPEHAEEAQSDAVFQFPKFGSATPARTSVVARPGMLLDYEVEICMIFDRPVRSIEDFDAAVKGFFLCGDFTDRAALVRLIDPDNLDSGRGFSDGKSGPDFFPTGPFLVIPRDWRAFIAAERMTTAVNGDPRQDARGGEMTLDFRELAGKALSDMDRARFLYAERYYRLSLEPEIMADMTLMSGTSEGVIFTAPTRGDIIEGTAWHVLSGRLFEGHTLVSSIIEAFVANEEDSGHFLQPGDVVSYRSSSMGDIRIEVRPPQA